MSGRRALARSAGVAAAVLLASATVRAQSGAPGRAASPWQVPEGEKARMNPFSARPEAVKRGRAIYRERCIVCHGGEGRGNGPAARMHAKRSGYAPADLSSPDLQARLTD